MPQDAVFDFGARAQEVGGNVLTLIHAGGNELFIVLILMLSAAILFPLFWSAWFFWRGEVFKEKLSRPVFLELRIPRELGRGPKAMHEVLSVMHALRNLPGDLEEKYWDGEFPRWFSLEMVSFGGEIHYYVRVYHRYRNILEAAFFSHYPEV
ncbi:MAG: hypothetical protein HY436_00865, partial [Candidatus Liptonbacteria bacterium]|nr:hypothetical protein [Candidatus Liptonbacteria bacterium]